MLKGGILTDSAERLRAYNAVFIAASIGPEPWFVAGGHPWVLRAGSLRKSF
jgi:hypothetical protein